MRPPAFESADLATIRTLRADLALQLARHIEASGESQVKAARSLGVPQPTLSKIIHGRTTNLSLELLLRIATRAQLPVVLLTGKEPIEAGVFVNGTAMPGRTQRSMLASRAHEELNARGQRLSPEQRLGAQLRHCELLAQLRSGGAARSGHGGRPPRLKRNARARRP